MSRGWRLAIGTWQLAGLAALVSCAGSLQDKECTLVGCQSGAGLEATLDVKYDDLRSAAITICRNDACFSGVLMPPAAEPMTHEGTIAPITGGNISGHVPYTTLTSDGGPWRLYVSWVESSLDAVQDGDTYRLSLTTSKGVALTTQTGSATYRDFQPNGPDCDPICRSASVALNP